MPALAERAMITALHISKWSGKLVDPEVTDDVSERNKAEQGAGTYSKNLVATRFFKDINSAASLGAATHKLLTLPWSDNGERILSNAGYMHYVEQMRIRRMKFEEAVDAFCTEENLSVYIREGEQRLGTMFRREEYPTVEQLKKKFGWDVEINKVPEGSDFRTKLADDTVKALVKDIERRSTERVRGAMKDVFSRIFDVTNKMSQKLKAYEPSSEAEASKSRFKDSLVTNALELAKILPSLNITEDPKIDTLTQQIIRDLGEHSPDVLRTDTKARAQTANKAEMIANKVKKYL